jgi:hypothetical protein
LWLKKVQFSASTFVVKIATFAKPRTVSANTHTRKLLDKKMKNNQKKKRINKNMNLLFVFILLSSGFFVACKSDKKTEKLKRSSAVNKPLMLPIQL